MHAIGTKYRGGPCLLGPSTEVAPVYWDQVQGWPLSIGTKYRGGPCLLGPSTEVAPVKYRGGPCLLGTSTEVAPVYWDQVQRWPLSIGNKYRGGPCLLGPSTEVAPVYWGQVQRWPLSIGTKYRGGPCLLGPSTEVTREGVHCIYLSCDSHMITTESRYRELASRGMCYRPSSTVLPCPTDRVVFVVVQLPSSGRDEGAQRSHVTVAVGEEEELHSNPILDTLLPQLLVGGTGSIQQVLQRTHTHN